MTSVPSVYACLRGKLSPFAMQLLNPAAESLGAYGALARLTQKHELSLVLCDNQTIRRLNARWRDMNQPTDVLSFPLHEIAAGELPPKGMVGDIIISIPYLRHAAHELGIPLEQHLQHLLVHGLLHLIGYDHETRSQQRRMRYAEQALLRGERLEP